MIYLDHNASNPPDPRVAAVYQRALTEGWANPSSLHGPGRAARAVVEQAREHVAAFAGVAPAQVTFTASGTEALNQAIETVTRPRERVRIVASAVEHPAVLTKLEELADAGRATVALAPVDADARVRPDAFVALLDAGAALAAVMAAQNEVGTVQPLHALGPACAAAGTPLLVDASQAAGRLPWRWADVPWDYLVLSGHKLRAPRGAAALVHRGCAPEPRPVILGGGQELGRRGGTEAVPAIAALGEACRLAAEGTLQDLASLSAERRRLEAALLGAVPGLEILARDAERLPQTTACLVPGRGSEALLASLDLAGIHASSGSACSSGAMLPSHVLRAMGIPADDPPGRLRISFGPETTPADLDRAVEALARLLMP